MPSYEQIKINLSSSFCSWMYFWGYGALSKLELIFIGAIIGPVLPIIWFLAGWWGSLSFVTWS